MPEPQEPQEPIEPSEPVEPDPAEPVASEPQEPAEPQEPVEPSEPQEPQEPQEPEPPVREKHVFKVDGVEEEVEWTREELLEKARQGLAFTKKTQALSEWEKGNQQKLQLADRFLANQNVVKYAIAEELGYNPALVMGEIPQPDPQMREMYPEQYGRMVERYELAIQQKQAFEKAYQGLSALNAQSVNTAAFEKARITHELNDAEFAQVKQFVVENFKANQAGMYSEAQIQAAVRATVDRSATEKLNTANRVQQNLKKAANSAPKKPANQRQEKVSDEVAEARRFKEVAQSLSRYKPKQA